MKNVCMKFEKAGPHQTLVIDWTRKYDGRTGAKQYTPSFLKGGGHNYLRKHMQLNMQSALKGLTDCHKNMTY